MSLQIGIVGLPNVGKSTLFNALTRSRGAKASNYPFCTIDPNVGVVEVPDLRLAKLATLAKPEKVIPAVVEFVDIAGLVRGAARGEGLGNQFLNHIRTVDAICEVVRFFPGSDVIHVEAGIDPKRDREIVEAELILADLETCEKRHQKVVHGAKAGDRESQDAFAVLAPVTDALRRGWLASSVFTVRGGTVITAPGTTWTESQHLIARELQLLTSKPLLYAANISEQQLSTLKKKEVISVLGFENAAGMEGACPPKLGERRGIFLISAKIEEDLQGLEEAEATEYLKSLGVTGSGLDHFIAEAYALLGLLTFFTAGPKEVRAWTIPQGSKAPQASGVIHTDFERGFICAETISYSDYIACGDEYAAKERGKMRTEGKDYVVQDGDVVHVRFNV